MMLTLLTQSMTLNFTTSPSKNNIGGLPGARPLAYGDWIKTCTCKVIEARSSVSSKLVTVMGRREPIADKKH